MQCPIEQNPEMFEGIIEGLFPRYDPGRWTPFVGQPGTGAGGKERVTDVELAEIAKSISVGKAAGPDRILNLALKVAITETPEVFRSAMQKCLEEGFFPEVWKWKSRVLLSKNGETT